jgi:hypothetical protein
MCNKSTCSCWSALKWEQSKFSFVVRERKLDIRVTLLSPHPAPCHAWRLYRNMDLSHLSVWCKVRSLPLVDSLPCKATRIKEYVFLISRFSHGCQIFLGPWYQNRK